MTTSQAEMAGQKRQKTRHRNTKEMDALALDVVRTKSNRYHDIQVGHGVVTARIPRRRSWRSTARASEGWKGKDEESRQDVNGM